MSASRTHKTDKPSPSTSVLAVKLARTGADGTQGALVLSVGLLALGGILMAAGQSNRPKRRHTGPGHRSGPDRPGVRAARRVMRGGRADPT